jgi:glycosyltransferase involved in cell wall biosynthesis
METKDLRDGERSMRAGQPVGIDTCSPRVLFVYSYSGGPQRYRCIHPAEQLALRGIGCSLCSVTDPSLDERAEQSAVLVLHRVPADRQVERLIRKARGNGSIVLFDTDDLLFDPSQWGRMRKPSDLHVVDCVLAKDEARRFAKTIHLSDSCIVSTDYLAARVVALGCRAWVVRNAFSLEMLSISERALDERPDATGKFVIGYASGSRTHNRDFEEVAPALREILSRHREAELWIVGHLQLPPEWDTLSPRVRRVPFVPWQELPRILSRFDVNIAPLESGDPFCNAKSEIKWMEAALVGTPTVASRTDAFEHAIEQGETGFLAASPDEWFEHLETLTRDPDLRRKMGEQAREAALSAYHPAVRGKELIQTLNAIGELVHGRRLWPECEMSTKLQSGVLSTCDEEGSRLEPTFFRKALYSLRNRGLLDFLLRSLGFVLRHTPWRKRL